MTTPAVPFNTQLDSPLERLRELRASSSESVVRDGGLSRVQHLMARPGHIEDLLWDLAGSVDAPDVILLTGSAGSGKTAIIEHLLERDRSADDSRFGDHVADATHSDAPGQEQVDRLATFFAPFSDGNARPGGPTRLIAMNTGMAMHFFSDLAELEEPAGLSELENLLRERLGLPYPALPRAPWMDDAVLVINVDQRPTAGEPGDVFDQILERLDPRDPDGVLEGTPRCASCTVSDWCWPMANAELLSSDPGRAVMNAAAGAVALSRGRELPPRGLWDAAAELALSGLDPIPGEDPCFAIAKIAADGDVEALLEGLACHTAMERATEGSLVQELATNDPSYQPSLEAHIWLSDAGLTPSADGRHMTDWLAGPSGSAHPALLRAAAAVASGQVALPVRLLARAAWLGGRLQATTAIPPQFSAALAAQATDASPGEGVAGMALLEALSRVAEGLAAGFGVRSGPETFFPTEAPGPRVTEVLVRADLVNDGLVWTAPEGDPGRARNRRGAEIVGYRSLALALVVAGEVRLSVDLPMWSLLELAVAGTSPSSIDLDRFLGLRHAIEAVGRKASNDHSLPLLVTNRETGLKYRVAPYGPTTTLRAQEVV